MLHYKSRDGGDSSTSGVPELYNEMLSHLHADDFSYFAKWYELLLLEAHHEASENRTSFIWAKSPEHRESRGVCFSDLEISHVDVTSDMKYHYTFERRKGHFNENTPMNMSPLTVDDRVIISRQGEKVFNETTGWYLYTESIVNRHSNKRTGSISGQPFFAQNAAFAAYSLSKKNKPSRKNC